MTYTAVNSPNAPRPEQPVRAIADSIRHVEINYEREGSGPGSRFEGKLLEDVQAEVACRYLAVKLLDLPLAERLALLRQLARRGGDDW